jgi:hypothetical protein
MTLRAGQPGHRRHARTWIRWWIGPGPSLAWRLPLLAAVAVLLGWYAFRGLVRMAFIFDASPIISFLLAPVLLPLMALPALCFYLLLRVLPQVWRDAGTPAGRKAVNTLASLPAALLLAAFVDLLEIVAILRLGIRLPRLPFDPF